MNNQITQNLGNNGLMSQYNSNKEVISKTTKNYTQNFQEEQKNMTMPRALTAVEKENMV